MDVITHIAVSVWNGVF